jgi:hypothetical protein
MSRRIVEKEADIQKACTDILLLDGWRVIHTDLKQLRGMGVQEPGIADDLFIRYIQNGDPRLGVDPRGGQIYQPLCELAWIEWKRIDPRGLRTKASSLQKDWHTLERKRGALVLVAGEDFPATIEGFRDYYKASGLMRKRILS